MKKFLSIIITIILTLQSISLCFAEDTHWAKNYADELFEAGIVKGDLDGFRFESLVTRAEFVALINRTFNFTDENTSAFSDITENDWYYSELLKARKAGYLKGDLNGRANPESSVTRVEAVTMLYRVLNLNSKNEAVFSDASKIPEWGRDAVYTLAFNNILSGYEDNTFKPEKSLTRAEAFVVIYKSLPFVNEKEEETEEEKSESSTVTGVTVGGNSGGGSYTPSVVPAVLKITSKDETVGKETLSWSNVSSVYNVTIKRTTAGKTNCEAVHTIKTNSINVAQYASALVPDVADRLINETFLVTVSAKGVSVSETVNVTFPFVEQPELNTAIECVENIYYMVVSWDKDEAVKEYILKMNLDGTGYQDITVIQDKEKCVAKINTATLKDISYTLDAIENPFNLIPMATKSGTLENLFYYEDEEFSGVAKIVNPLTVNEAFDNIEAGDIILLDKGEYNNLSLSAAEDGTAQNKILIKSLADGGAVFNGESIITINSDYTTLSGISFVDNKGVDSCSIKVKECTNSRVTGCYFKTCGDVATGSILYLGKSAKNIRVDNNLFEDSRAMSVVAFGNCDTYFEDSATDNIINDNVFINIKSVSSAYSGATNGMECIQLGQSPKDGVKLNNRVSHNMFYNVTGDGSEIISNKSNGNIYKNNTFYNCNSSPTLRNGDECEFSGNFIINCKYALRTFGKNHKIENNYIYKTGHIAFDAGYQILDKIIYSSADNCQVKGNMIIKPKDSAIYYGRFYDTLNLRNTLANNIIVEDNYIYADKGKVCTYHAAFNPIDLSDNIIIDDGISDIPTFDGELYITSQMNFSTSELYRPWELNIWWKDALPQIKGYDTLEEKGKITGYTPYKTAFSLCSEDTLDVTTLAGTVRVSGGSYKVNSADVSYTLADETYASLTGDILTVTNDTEEIKEVLLNSSYAGFENQITISVYPKAPYSDATKDYFDYQTNVDLKVISGSTLWEAGADGSVEFKGTSSTKIILPTYTHKDDFSLEFDLTLNSGNPSSANLEFLFGYDVISGTAHRVKLLNNGGVFLTSDNNTRSGELVKQLEIGVTKRMQIVKRDDILVVSYGDDILTMAKLPEETSGKFGLNLSSCNIKLENIDIFEEKADSVVPKTISMTYSRIDDNTIKVNYTSIGNYIYRLFKDGICLGESSEVSNFVDVSVTMDENHEYKLYAYDKTGVLVGEGELSLTITASSSGEYFKISDVLVKVGENDSYVENYYKSSNRFLDEYTEIYDDRDYTYSSLPEMFKDCGYILTRNSDRTLDSYKTAKSDWLKFKINQPATVYIVLQASHTVPSWLADWGVYSGDLVSTDTLSSTKVYLKHFDGGDVTIGSFSTLSANYSVIVKPDTMPESIEIIRKFK